MANKYKGEVSFEAGGDPYTLRFSANAVVGIEDAFGKSIAEIGEMMADPTRLRMANVKEMFCIGLIDHCPDIGNAKAVEVFRCLSPIEATEIVVKAFSAAFGVEEGGQAATAENPPQPAASLEKAGTG